MAIGPDTSLNFQGYLNSIVTVVMMMLVLVILANAVWRWMQVLRGRVQTVPLTVE